MRKFKLLIAILWLLLLGIKVPCARALPGPGASPSGINSPGIGFQSSSSCYITNSSGTHLITFPLTQKFPGGITCTDQGPTASANGEIRQITCTFNNGTQGPPSASELFAMCASGSAECLNVANKYPNLNQTDMAAFNKCLSYAVMDFMIGCC